MKHQGFTFMEMLIVLVILALITGAVFTLTYQGQKSFHTEAQLNETTRQARIALDQIARYLRQAGNAPVAALGVSAIEILGEGHIRINADITGAVPSITAEPKESTGDPDGTLSSIHEVVVIRHYPQSGLLVMDIGYGTEMVVADNVAALGFTFFDLAGNPTTNVNNIARANVVLTARTEMKDMHSGTPNLVTMQSDVFLRSRSFNLITAP